MADKRTWKFAPEDGNEVAFISEYDGERMIRFVCEFIDPPTAEDAAMMIAAKNAATPTADAALADAIDSLGFVIRGDNPPVKEWVSECGGGCMPATKEEKMMWDVLQAAAALRARSAVPEGFVMVPVEPTPEMFITGGEVFFDQAKTYGISGSTENDQNAAAGIYRAMLAAKPAGGA